MRNSKPTTTHPHWLCSFICCQSQTHTAPCWARFRYVVPSEPPQAAPSIHWHCCLCHTPPFRAPQCPPVQRTFLEASKWSYHFVILPESLSGRCCTCCLPTEAFWKVTGLGLDSLISVYPPMPHTESIIKTLLDSFHPHSPNEDWVTKTLIHWRGSEIGIRVSLNSLLRWNSKLGINSE